MIIYIHKEMRAMQKKIWDKFPSIIIMVLSIIWFFVEKSKGFFTNMGFNEINDIIPLITVFSAFYTVCSFVWDQKFASLYKQIEEYEEELNGELKELLVAELSKPQLIESRILFEYETNLINYLSLQPENGEYAQIYVITNDAGVENNDFGDAICENIINNHQYVYVTPFEESTFMERLCETLFRTKPDNIDKKLLDAAIRKNIRHIQDENFFKILPEYSDMVIYRKRQQVAFNSRNEVLRGFYSFQSGPKNDHNVNCYFYNTMTNDLAQKIVGHIEKWLKENGKIDLSSENYITSNAEIKRSEVCGCYGLFCTKEIKKGEVILKKGGRFILKKNLDNELFSNVKYIQVSEDYVVSSLTPADDRTLGFPINHNCRHPNCGFASAIEIVATRRIDSGEEILIDYAYFDPDYARFTCKGCDNCSRTSCKGSDIKEELQKGDAVLERVSPYLKDIIMGGKHEKSISNRCV